MIAKPIFGIRRQSLQLCKLREKPKDTINSSFLLNKKSLKSYYKIYKHILSTTVATK